MINPPIVLNPPCFFRLRFVRHTYLYFLIYLLIVITIVLEGKY